MTFTCPQTFLLIAVDIWHIPGVPPRIAGVLAAHIPGTVPSDNRKSSLTMEVGK